MHLGITEMTPGSICSPRVLTVNQISMYSPASLGLCSNKRAVMRVGSLGISAYSKSVFYSPINICV